jgi:hypothetical protein
MSLATQCARENSFGASKRSPVTSFTILYFIWSYLLLLPLPPEKIFFLVIHPQPHTHKCVHVQSHIHIHTHAMLHSTVRERQFSWFSPIPWDEYPIMQYTEMAASFQIFTQNSCSSSHVIWCYTSSAVETMSLKSWRINETE